MDEPVDRPPAVMVNPAVASDKATVHLGLQARWDLRTRPTADNIATIAGQRPDLSRASHPPHSPRTFLSHLVLSSRSLEPATNPPVRTMFIVADELPWAISIKQYNIITCQNLLDAIYKTLQEPIKRDEFFCAPVKKRAMITKVAMEVRLLFLAFPRRGFSDDDDTV